MSLSGKFINYLKETKIELKHVNWPTKKKTAQFTFLVIGISFAVAAFLGFFDAIFKYLLNTFVLKI
jgi:preprotein translocase subunit SecE